MKLIVLALAILSLGGCAVPLAMGIAATMLPMAEVGVATGAGTAIGTAAGKDIYDKMKAAAEAKKRKHDARTAKK